MSWSTSLQTYIWVFSIGRGNAIFVRTGLNQGFVLDMGGGTLFDPARFIREHFVPQLDKYQNAAIAQTVLSHPHADHIAQCEEASDGKALRPALLTCPNDKTQSESLDWSRIEDPIGQNKELIDTYKKLFERRNPPLQTICYDSPRTIPNLEYGIFYVRPPVCDKLHTEDTKYGNATSIVFYLRHGSHSILVPGDITPEAMNIILDQGYGLEKRYTVFDSSAEERYPNWHVETKEQPSLRSVLGSRGLSILVAPHHGLESCFCPELFDAMNGGKPRLNVISERRQKNTTPGRIHPRYQSQDGASGENVEIEGTTERRYSVTTVGGHHILIVFSGTGRPRVYADPNPDRLLEIAAP